MPIGNLTKGKGFAGVLKYIWASIDHAGQPRPTVEWIAGPVRDTDPRAAARHFGFVRRTRQNRRDAVRHISIRAAPEDIERFTPDLQAEIAERVAETMQYDTWTAVTHGDHLHLVGSLVRSDGSVAPDGWNYRRLEGLLHEIREEYGFAGVRHSPAMSDAPTEPAGPKPGEKRYRERTGQLSEKQRLKAAIQDAAETAQGHNAQAFLDALEAAGIDVQAQWTKDNRLYAFSVALPGGEKGPMRASAVDRSMTVKSLAQRYGIQTQIQEESHDPGRTSGPDRERHPGTETGPAADRAEDQHADRSVRDRSRSEREPDRAALDRSEQSDRRHRDDDRQHRDPNERNFRDRLRQAADRLLWRFRLTTGLQQLPPEPGLDADDDAMEFPEDPGPSGPGGP